MEWPRSRSCERGPPSNGPSRITTGPWAASNGKCLMPREGGSFHVQGNGDILADDTTTQESTSQRGNSGRIHLWIERACAGRNRTKSSSVHSDNHQPPPPSSPPPQRLQPTIDPEKMTVVDTLLEGVARYNPENAPQLEAHLHQQCKEGTYHLDVNLSLLKLYQFKPAIAKPEFVLLVLAKALMALPESDFTMALYLVSEGMVCAHRGGTPQVCV